MTLITTIKPMTRPAIRKAQNETQPMRYQWLPKGQPPGRKRSRGITALRTNASKMKTVAKIDKILGPVCMDSAPSPARGQLQASHVLDNLPLGPNVGKQTECMPTLNLIQEVMK